MTVLEVRNAIVQFSFEERAELNRLLYGWEDDAWDKQMAEDVEQGRLNDAVARAEADMKAGQFRELP